MENDISADDPLHEDADSDRHQKSSPASENNSSQIQIITDYDDSGPNSEIHPSDIDPRIIIQ